MRGVLLLKVVFLCLLIVQVSCVNHPKDDANAVMDSLRNALDASPESVLHEIDSLKNTGYGHSEKEKHDLDILYVSARNKTYVELNEEDLKKVESAILYYENHKNKKRLLECYYLLGSIYRDLGESPMALESFHKALDCSNGSDDPKLLSRVYGQISDLMAKQGLYKSAVEMENKAIETGLETGDSANILGYKGSQLRTNFMMGDYTLVSEQVCNLYSDYIKIGDTLSAGRCLSVGIMSNIRLGKWEDASGMLAKYEEQSGYVDMKHDVRKGHEIYYYMKGLCLLHQNKSDSAELFFRRELNTTIDWNNRQAAYDGLSQLYEQRQEKDSVIKYGELLCVAIDSSYQERIAITMMQMQKQYDYSSYQERAYASEKRLIREKNRKVVWSISLFALAVIAFFAYYALWLRFRQKRTLLEAHLSETRTKLFMQEKKRQEVMENLRALENYHHEALVVLEQKKEQLASQEKALNELKSESIEDKESIQQLRQEMEDLKEEILLKEGDMSELKKVISAKQEEQETLSAQMEKLRDNVRQNIDHSFTIAKIKVKASNGKTANEEDWDELQSLVVSIYPQFIDRLRQNVPMIKPFELQVCILMKLGFSFKEISALLPRSQGAITNIRKRLACKALNLEDCTADDADKWILSL